MSELWSLWDRYFPRRPDYPNRPRRVPSRPQVAGGSLPAVLRPRPEAAGSHRRKSTPRSSCAPNQREFDFAPGTILLPVRMGRSRSSRVNGHRRQGLFEYEGQTFKSLTAVARPNHRRALVGAAVLRFGPQGRCAMNDVAPDRWQQESETLRGLLPGVLGRTPRPGNSTHRRPEGGGPRLYCQPARRGLDSGRR